MWGSPTNRSGFRAYHAGVLRSRRTLSYFVAALVAANAWLWLQNSAPRQQVRILTAGKGSAVLIETGRRAVLINAGSDASIVRALGQALPPWKRRLDALVLTNASATYAGGAREVLRAYRPAIILRTSMSGSATVEKGIGSAASTTFPVRGDRYTLGNDTFMDVLWPPVTPAPMTGKGAVLVVRVTSAGKTLLIYDALPAGALRTLRVLPGFDERLPVISSTTPAGIWPSS